MSDHDMPGPRRPRWLPLVPVVMLAVVVGLAGCEGPHHPSSGSPAGTVRPTGAAAPTASTCLPRVVESGFTFDQGYVWYGLLVENPCPYPLIDNVVDVAALDASGRRLDADHPLTTPALPAILPGQRLGLAAQGYLRQDRGPARLSVKVTSAQRVTLGSFADWPKPVIRDLTLGRPDAAGFATATFTVDTEPPGRKLCHPVAAVILRDHSGHIVLGMSQQTQPVEGSPLRVDLPVPPRTDPARTEVYVTQGVLNLRDSLAVLTCHAPA